MAQIKQTLSSRQFWIVAVMLLICSFFHYYTPQLPLLPQNSFPLTRQAVVRIIFLLPVAASAFVFGRAGGLITLGLSVLIMLPRVFWISEQPIDALFETIGIAMVGFVIVWVIETQEREKKLRQRAVEELEAVNSVALTLTEPYHLDAMLEKALSRVLEVVGSLEPRGAIFLLDPWGQTLQLRAHQNLSPAFIEKKPEIPLGECLCGLTAESGDVLIVRDALHHPQHTRCPDPEPHAHICVPLVSKRRTLGVMDFYLKTDDPIDTLDRGMFAALGRQIGVAVENARLCENLRFYVRQITRAQEDERSRIARDLHDDTAQGLIDLSRRLDALATSFDEPPKEAVERMEDLYQRIEDLLDGVQRFSRDLRPSVLDDLGLLPALESQLTELREDGFSTQLEISGDPHRLPSGVEAELFRIAQEALNNVKRHSHASEVVIHVEFKHERARVTIQDDGQGFELLGSPGDFAITGRFGLLGMEERVQLLRGQFKVLTGKDKGTIVIVDVPTHEE